MEILSQKRFTFFIVLIIILMQSNVCSYHKVLRWPNGFNRFSITTTPGTVYNCSEPIRSILPKLSVAESISMGVLTYITEDNETSTDETFSDEKTIMEFKAIFPGTLWCGTGDIANSDNELGIFTRTDACCRSHDKCPFTIPKNSNFGPLINHGLFTRSACFCGRQFYECLKNAKDEISDVIGMKYFNILAPQCIGYDYPATGECILYSGNKCFFYKVDNTKSKVLQWLSSRNY